MRVVLKHLHIVEIVLHRGMSHCGLYKHYTTSSSVSPSFILPLSIFFSAFIWPSVSPLRLSNPLFPFTVFKKEGKGFKAQPFSKNACFLRFRYSLNGLIVYGENIYKEYNRKEKTLLILSLFETEKQSWREKKYPKKCQWKGCRHPRTKLCCLAVTAQCFSI